jgi:DNA helicase-2/ATP-dependent DNA helicase PcrA
MAHTKDFICYLRLAVNPWDEQSLRRVLGHQPGLGPKGVETVVEFALKQANYDRLLAEAPKITAKAKKSLEALSGLLVDLHSAEVEDDVPALVELALKHYADLLPVIHPDDHPGRLIDVQEAAAMAAEAGDLVLFLSELALDPPNTLSVGPESGRGRNDLTLSTVHSAKGLEWSRVYIISAVEGRFPSMYCRGDKELEEELRLMYVAVTRARERLTVLMPANTAAAFDENAPSRFLSFLNPGEAKLFVDGKESRNFEFLRSRKKEMFPETERLFRSVSTSLGNRFRSDDSPGPGNASRFAASPPRPAFSHPLLADPGPPPKKALAPAARERPPSPRKGQRVKHSTFGPGIVVSVSGPNAIIDFDQVGHKVIMHQSAKLVLLAD